MKLIVFIICFSAFGVLASSSYSQSTKLSLNVNNTSIKEVLLKIESNSEFFFLYNNNLIDVEKKVNMDVSDKKITVILEQLFEGQDVNFSILDRQIIISPKEMGKTIYSLQPQVKGKVTNETGEPLPGVTVLIKGTTRGTITDIDGKYSVAASSENVLVFSFVGMKPQEIKVGNQTSIDVALLTDAIGLEEVVAIGYGTKKKISLVSSISSISEQELAERPARSFSLGLQGLVPGLTVWDQGGEPGTEGAQLRIRGITSLSGNDPLIIVDGIEQELKDIDPLDVASVSVLKDAASTAIYGSRAANGVLLITTKRGKEGKLKITYNGRLELQNITNKPKHMGTEDYMNLVNFAYVNRGSQPIWSDETIQKTLAGDDLLHYPLPNVWFDIIPVKNAPEQNHNLSLSGGNENLKTFTSFSYQNQESVYPNRNYIRYQVRTNNNIKISNSINGEVDLRIMHSDRARANNSSMYSQMTHGGQWAVPMYPDGTYGLSPQRHNPLMYSDPDYFGMLKNKQDYVTSIFTGTWSILSNLKFISQIGWELQNEDEMINTPTYEVVDYWTKKVLKSNNINQLSDARNTNKQLTWNNTLNYNVKIKNHNIEVLGGYSEISHKYDFLSANGRQFYNNKIIDLGQSDPQTRIIDNGITEWGLRSYFGRINYSFNDKYLLEMNSRYDGSSRFPKNSRYTFFPSVAGAWVVSKEAFWKNLENTIDLLKLRASVGKTGNQNIGLYTYFENLTVGNYYAFNNQSVVGVRQTELASKELTWETTKQTNFGIDLSMFDRKLTVTADLYKKITDGILLKLPIPGVIGLNPVSTNAGSVQNIGWDAQIGYKNKIRELKYSVGLYISDVKNEILDLAGTGPYYSFPTANVVGEEVNALWGYETDGLLKQSDLDNKYPTFSTDAKPGDIKFVDQLTVDTDNDGIPDKTDGRISADDQKVIGSTIPRFTYGSSINLEWKNFDFNLQLQGVLKQDMILQGAFTENGSWEGFALAIGTDYYTEDNQDARFPRPQKQTNKNLQPSDWWIIEGAYLRVKNVQIGYNIPNKVSSILGIKDSRVYIGGTNLLTLSNLLDWGIDAETPSGRALYHYPTKTVVFGLTLNF